MVAVGTSWLDVLGYFENVDGTFGKCLYIKWMINTGNKFNQLIYLLKDDNEWEIKTYKQRCIYKCNVIYYVHLHMILLVKLCRSANET